MTQRTLLSSSSDPDGVTRCCPANSKAAAFCAAKPVSPAALAAWMAIASLGAAFGAGATCAAFERYFRRSSSTATAPAEATVAFKTQGGSFSMAPNTKKRTLSRLPCHL